MKNLKYLGRMVDRHGVKPGPEAVTFAQILHSDGA